MRVKLIWMISFEMTQATTESKRRTKKCLNEFDKYGKVSEF